MGVNNLLDKLEPFAGRCGRIFTSSRFPCDQNASGRQIITTPILERARCHKIIEVRSACRRLDSRVPIQLGLVDSGYVLGGNLDDSAPFSLAEYVELG